MSDVFLEIVIPASGSPSERHEIEDELAAALDEAGLGEVSGGGVSASKMNIDIDIEEEDSLPEALTIIRSVLRRHNVPNNTTIHRHKPVKEIFGLND
jgi:hypothetical protein